MITYYVGASMDGFIATEDDSLDFLDSVGVPEGEDYGYGPFYQSVDVCAWGRKTYDWVMERADFPYPEKENWIFSQSQTGEGDNGEQFAVFKPNQWRELSKTKHIWMVGGCEVATLFQNENLIDQIILTVIPVSIATGKGIFKDGLIESQWNHESEKSWTNGVVQKTFSLIRQR